MKITVPVGIAVSDIEARVLGPAGEEMVRKILARIQANVPGIETAMTGKTVEATAPILQTTTPAPATTTTTVMATTTPLLTTTTPAPRTVLLGFDIRNLDFTALNPDQALAISAIVTEDVAATAEVCASEVSVNFTATSPSPEGSHQPLATVCHSNVAITIPPKIPVAAVEARVLGPPGKEMVRRILEKIEAAGFTTALKGPIQALGCCWIPRAERISSFGGSFSQLPNPLSELP